MELTQEIINTYLWFAYFPPKEIPAWLDDCISPENRGATYSPTEAAIRFDEIFDRLLSENPADTQIVPLSGGWDSRAILGALLERLDSAQIEAITFGIPGQLDYDIGFKVAKWARVKHHALDLRTVDFTWDAILNSVKKSQWTYTPDGFFNQQIAKYADGHNSIIWSGFMGDSLTGRHLSEKLIHPDHHFKKFVFSQRRLKHQQISQTLPRLNKHWPASSHNTTLLFDDLLDVGIRQIHCIAPIVLSDSNWRSWKTKSSGIIGKSTIIAPFADKTWAGYWLSAPHDQRRNQKLFFKLMDLKFAQLFSLPSKDSLGLPPDAKTRYQIKRINHGIRKRIQGKAPWLRIRSSTRNNYLDYDEMFRKRRDYKETLVTAFDYLKANDVVPWVDIDKLWKEHMRRRKDHGEAFQVLLGLAANLFVEQNNRSLKK
jgi:hypothetical protein